MPSNLRDIIDDAIVLFRSADVHHHNAYNYFRNCADQLDAENFSGAATQMRLAANELEDINWTQSHWPNPSSCYATDALYWIDDNWLTDGVEYELTMSKIMAVMWDSKPYQTLLFIPMIDAMRGSIWNKTVTEQWMSNALKHFQE